MNIEQIEIRYHHKNAMASKSCDKLKHIKSLPWFSVVQSCIGNYEIQLDDSPTYETGDGGFFIAPSQVVQTITHNINPAAGQMSNRWIFIEVVINNTYRLDYLYDFPILIPADLRQEMNDLFDRLFRTDNLCDEMSVYYQIIKLLLKIAVPKKIFANKTLVTALDYIKAHYSEKITMDQLAAACYVSKSYLYEIFRINLETSPIAYLNHYRVSLASELLKQTAKPIGDIAELVGLYDSAYFNKLFRKTFHVSPREYRKSII